jgi:hypothetical protein
MLIMEEIIGTYLLVSLILVGIMFSILLFAIGYDLYRRGEGLTMTRAEQICGLSIMLLPLVNLVTVAWVAYKAFEKIRWFIRYRHDQDTACS